MDQLGWWDASDEMEFIPRRLAGAAILKFTNNGVYLEIEISFYHRWNWLK